MFMKALDRLEERWLGEGTCGKEGEIMSANRSRTSRRISFPQKRRAVVASMLALILVIGSGILAQVTRKKNDHSTGTVSPQSLSPNVPSKEYIYAGAKLVATRERTASSNGDDAQCISVCAYDTYEPGICKLNGMAGPFGQDANYLVEVTMLNTGTTTWTSANGYKLGSQSPANNTIWGASREALPTTVSPGQQVKISFSARKTIFGGPPWFVNFQWQMVQDSGVGFFGEKTPTGQISTGVWLPLVGPSGATFVSQSVPSLMFAGQNYPVSITMNNPGSNTWTSAGNYKLGSQVAQDNNTWGMNRVALPTSVPQGSNVTFSFNAAAPSSTGLYNFQWMMVQDGAGGIGFFGDLTPPTAMTVTSRAALGYLDYNLDTKTDLGIWRPSTKQWLIDTNLNGTVDNTYTFGGTGDLPVPSDYNGDGKADLANVKLSSMSWTFDFDRNGTADQTFTFGAGNDIPTPQDYNGDKQTDVAVFRPSTGQWLVDTNRDGTSDLTVTFGQSGDIPVPADYDGDGKADFAVFRPSTGQWRIDTDRNGTADITVTLGQNGDIPISLDFNGDGKADLVVFRPSTGQWIVDTNRDGTADTTITLGQNGDIPVAGDYNGDGVPDLGVFRPSNSKWYIDTNRDGVADYILTFGLTSDIPLRQNGWILKAMGILPL
jgi:VCBS repeat protein